MKVGITLFAQNFRDWDRFEALERGEKAGTPSFSDTQVFEDEVRLGEQIEPLGFDSIWSVEHHFTPYTMVTNVAQFLTFWAGRTSRIGLGTMVAVIPWHHPLRLAEELVMLQHLLGDRELTVGFGRGAGRREFGGMSVPMGESRGRFLEALEIIRLALTEERFSFEGEYFTLPDVQQRPESPTLSLRPRPRDAERLLESMHCAWGTPQTAPIAAKAGLKPLIIPQKSFEEYGPELEAFNKTRAEAGHQPAAPALVTWFYCAETEDEAREGAVRYMREYAESSMRHYELAGAHFANTKGYEHYAAMSEQITAAASAGDAAKPGFADAFLRDHIWGTPDQCIEKLKAANAFMGPSEFIGVAKYGGMPVELAEKSLQLFAKEVLPAAHELEPADTPVVATS
ncbi:LLM class flavin-dependent oxidoreductase [Amycolatopsis jejuensis]|uniref:LLM class flavin-dependent oxidoreductase n=1 Tax=Amycolatopsis jejuensis TaxID=330084 RepID=UPI0005251068|nr:LLM class flavin-dependent oxidoreductase [Amycolatopsis jejuensis]